MDASDKLQVKQFNVLLKTEGIYILLWRHFPPIGEASLQEFVFLPTRDFMLAVSLAVPTATPTDRNCQLGSRDYLFKVLLG